MLLDVGVGFSPPVGVLRNFVQSDVVNQEVGAGVRTHDADLSVANFCNIHHYCDFRLLLLLMLLLLQLMQLLCRCYHHPKGQDQNTQLLTIYFLTQTVKKNSY